MVSVGVLTLPAFVSQPLIKLTQSVVQVLDVLVMLGQVDDIFFDFIVLLAVVHYYPIGVN